MRLYTWIFHKHKHGEHMCSQKLFCVLKAIFKAIIILNKPDCWRRSLEGDSDSKTFSKYLSKKRKIKKLLTYSWAASQNYPYVIEILESVQGNKHCNRVIKKSTRRHMGSLGSDISFLYLFLLWTQNKEARSQRKCKRRQKWP